MKTRYNKNYMSIGASVRTTKFAARNNGIGVRQESNPQSPTAYSSVRCAKVSAPLQLLHIGARITSADVLKRFRSRKNLQHIYGLAKFPQESKLSEETSPIRAPLAEIPILQNGVVFSR